MAEHGDWWSGGLVVIGRKQAPAKGANSERREIGAGDVLRTERTGQGFDTLAPYTQAPAPGLEGGNFFELRSFGLQALVQGEGNHAPSVLGTAFDAALVAFADAVEPAGIRNGQGTEHYGVDQGKDGGSAADSQSQCEHGRGGKDRRQPELPQSVPKIAWQAWHGAPLPTLRTRAAGGSLGRPGRTSSAVQRNSAKCR